MIKSIPTKYNGTKFKSKLEASWAKWLDEKHIVWCYETEGFDLYGDWYLPDFWLPEIRTIIEVKGALQGINKVFQLSQQFYYDEGDWNEQHDNVFVLLGGSPVPAFYNIHDTCDYRLLNCENCGRITITTVSSHYLCRCCGKYLTGSPKNSPLMQTLPKPWGWPI